MYTLVVKFSQLSTTNLMLGALLQDNFSDGLMTDMRTDELVDVGTTQ